MMCAKHMLLYVLMFPMSYSPPLFLCALALAFFLRMRPCGYCLTISAILFLSISSNSPFLTNHSPPPTSTLPFSYPSIQNETISLSDLPMASPVPDRTWMTPNKGRIWDPTIVGYRVMSAAVGKERAARWAEEDGEAKRRFGSVWQAGPRALKRYYDVSLRPCLSAWLRTDVSGTTGQGKKEPETKIKERRLPGSYLDLRWKGIGFVLDLGWKRTEEGLQWEVEEMLGRDWDRTELLVKEAQESDKVEGLEEVPSEDVPAAVEEVQDEPHASKKTKSFWGGMPLLGSW